MGWNWVEQISRRHEVWLLTSDEFQSQIEQVITPRVHPTYIPSFRRWHWLQQRIIPGLHWLYYYWWQWKAYRVARRLHARVGFDLAHHVTFVSWRAPSFISMLPIPFIWGPIGGGGTPPRSLAGELGWRGRLSEGFRALCQHLPRFDPTVRLTMRRAALILANIQQTADLIPKCYQDKVRLMFGIGVPATELRLVEMASKNGMTFVVLFVAQLRPIKGGSLAIRAFAELARQCPDCKLLILGEGDERHRLEALAGELGVRPRLEFAGWLPRQEVLVRMQRADVLLHPSLRDSGGMVLLEAMAQNKPVVCLDLGGPGEIVTDDCGIKVTPGKPQQVVFDLATALIRLAQNPLLCRKFGEEGRRRVAEVYDWTKRGEQLFEVYDEVTRG